MGHWEEESGYITLPAAEFASVRQAVQKAEHDHQNKVFEETQAFWKGLSRKEQTDSVSYKAAVKRDSMAREAAQERASQIWRVRPTDSLEDLNEDIRWRLHISDGAKPARVLKSDLPFPTNRTTSFEAGSGEIVFDKPRNMVRWDTGQEREAVGRTHNSPAGRALFERIKTVKWTRGTGGVVSGSSEYALDDGVGREPCRAYGPIGAAQHPGICEAYWDSKGNHVGSRELSALQAQLWEAERKLHAKMTKATAAAGRGKTTAASNRGSFASASYRESNIRLGGW